MHTVELLAEALNLAGRLGYEVRQEWLAGNGGGACELKGRKILFLDLALGPADSSIWSFPRCVASRTPCDCRWPGNCETRWRCEKMRS